VASESLLSFIHHFEAFKVSMTLNLAQRSFKVIYFGGNRKFVYDFIGAYRPLIVIFALSSTVSEIAGFIHSSRLMCK